MNFKKLAINATLALSLVLTSTPSAADAAAFKDTTGHWADAAIQWARDNKVASGYPDDTFKPDNVVTEEEFVAMLLNSFPAEEAGLALPERWSDEIYVIARRHNYPVTEERDVLMKRHRVAELVAATQGKNYREDLAIAYVMGSGLASGKVVGEFTIDSFKGEDTLTRGEAVAFIQKLKQNPKASKVLLDRPLLTSSTEEVKDIPKTKFAPGTLPTTPEQMLDTKYRLNLEACRLFEMAVHSSYKFGPDSLTVTLPKMPKGYVLDVQYYVENKDGSYGDLGYDVWQNGGFISGNSYTMKVDWSKVKEGYFRAGVMDVSNGGVRRYSYYQYSTEEIVEKVDY